MSALQRVRAALAAGERPSDDDVREVCANAHIAEAALALFAARNARNSAKTALKAYRVEHGCCDGDEENSACYYTRGLQFDQWCAICIGAQPLWLEWRRAARARGAALTKLYRRCASVAAIREPK